MPNQIKQLCEKQINEFKLDDNAHSKNHCSFNVISLCSSEEQKVKRYLHSCQEELIKAIAGRVNP